MTFTPEQGFQGFQGFQGLWHIEVDENNAGGAPLGIFQPLCAMKRPTIEQFKEQLGFLETYSALRPERASEIVAQLGLPFAFLPLSG